MSMIDARNAGLPEPVVRWIFSHSHQNYWRVAAWYEIDDLIQDGLLVACKCLNRYGPIVGDTRRVRLHGVTQPHFMALVKTAFTNRVTDLARRKQRSLEDLICDVYPDKTEKQVLQVIPDPEPVLDFWLLLAEMPDYLRRAAMLFFVAETARKVRHSRVRLNRRSDTLTERVRALAGFPEDRDFETELRAYIKLSNQS